MNKGSSQKLQHFFEVEKTWKITIFRFFFFGLEQIEKSENVQFQAQNVTLET